VTGHWRRLSGEELYSGDGNKENEMGETGVTYRGGEKYI
jgi:hypothetical protein